MTIEHGTGTAAGPAARPRGRNVRWVIIAVITVLAVIAYLDRGNLSVAAPLIRRDLHISNTTMGVVLSAFVWPYAIMNLPSGWAVDRFGAKALMAVAAALWSVLAVGTGLARNVVAFIALRVGLGVAEAPLFPAALKATDAWFPDREKAAATGVYIAGTQAGLAIAPPIATALMVAFGWPAMFVIMGAVGLLALAAWLVVYRHPDRHPWLSTAERDYIAAGKVSRTEPAAADAVTARSWLGLFRYGSVWAMIIGAFCLQYVFWFYITWLPSYLESAQHFAIGKAGFLAAVPYVAGGVAVILGGRLSDRLIARGLAPLAARRYVIAGGALLTTVALVITAFSAGPVLAMVMLTVGMFTYSLTSGTFWTLATEVVRTSRLVGSVGSIQNFGGFLGGACAPIATGVLVDASGGFTLALTAAAVLCLVSAALYGLVLRHRLPV